jgi:hypothetical protein
MASEREDFLTEDHEIPGQRFCLLSFLSPEKILKNKDIFMFDKFLQTFEYTQRVTSFESFLMSTVKGINDVLNAEADKAEDKDLSGAATVIREARVRMDTLMDAFQKYTKDYQSELKESKLKALYDDFIHSNRDKLEEEFYAKNEFRTTVRGLKVRGVYNSNEEAVARSKKLQRQDTLHNIFVGEVGKWLPWDPEPSQIGEQEYAEEKLNTLMKKYKENEEAREMYERETRSKMSSTSRKAAVGAEGAVEPAAAEDHEGLFGNTGFADLAIARKSGQDKD